MRERTVLFILGVPVTDFLDPTGAMMGDTPWYCHVMGIALDLRDLPGCKDSKTTRRRRLLALRQNTPLNRGRHGPRLVGGTGRNPAADRRNTSSAFR